MRVPVSIVLASAILATGVATAASPPKFRSGTYKGMLTQSLNYITVKLKLSRMRVTGLTLSDVPVFNKCGALGIQVHFVNATISKGGTFRSTGKHVISFGPLKGHVAERLTIKGQFTTKGKLSGTVTVVVPRAPTCGGTTTFTASKK